MREREEERRLSAKTLAIASAASFVAAIVTSQFSTAGTPIAAALTPVIVTLVSELLNRPAERIAQRFTAETAALPREEDTLPEAAGAGPPPPHEERDPRPAREQPARDPYLGRTAPGEVPEFRVYRTSPLSRRLRWKPILVTAAIAFAIAAMALTVPELIAGQSVSGGGRNFTLWGGEAKKKKAPGTDTQTGTLPGSQATEPEKTVPELQPKPEATAPDQTATQPQATQPPAQTAPAPRSQSPAP
jgi:hypothetical protein